MCQISVANNKTLESDFKLLVASFISAEGVINHEVMDGVFKALVSKLANNQQIHECLS